VTQHETIDTGLACLLTIADFHGIPADAEGLRHEFHRESAFDTQTILLAARNIGLTAKSVRQEEERLTPAIQDMSSQENHRLRRRRMSNQV